ncbi:RelA/SpoT family protein [uncultured Duncaniella sp.]|uniref:RelA/SpoT family protein n=1 Tax=uncultured Duncaniella sp. TaxID=2768039 RepID=UPI0025B732A5|nr:RelA/SpoT family protein [uncultured Duncaniella sp.]
MEKTPRPSDERAYIRNLVRRLLVESSDVAKADDFTIVKKAIKNAYADGRSVMDRHGLNKVAHTLETSIALCDMVSPDRNMIIATLVYGLCVDEALSLENVRSLWDEDVERMVNGLRKVSTLYGKQGVVKTDNFRRLLMTFAEDIRVIIIMIVERLTLMRAINHHPDEKFVTDTAFEANYLYAPLAHRLGLYKIKSELEDMSLKYSARETYTKIARELNETKVARDAYIANFIAPLKEKLDATGLKYEIKGRTKSIYSIWNKLRKQQVELSGIYDLFAIRVILDVPLEREKADCWNVYSIVADMYTPNPARMKDWLSIPKSNGYESLHTTVKGPDNKWVEVQIRTKRMDLVAEKGLAAHWKYKGIKSEGDLDTWMNNIRDILETADGPMELMKNFKMDLYDKEVFVFTPRGDLYRLPLGATVLDFAFNIHSKLGCTCVGGKVNGRNRKLNYKLHSGDTVEITTAPGQVPKQDWLSFVVTSKARNKIRQTINERANRSAELGKELLQRRCKNRKVELEEGTLMRTIKKMGYRTVTDFYKAIGDEVIDVNDVITQYELIENADKRAETERRSAEEFELLENNERANNLSADILIIGDNIKGINYKLSKCCNPIFGDDVFGFVSAEGVIKIHRHDCPNAEHIRYKYPYRVIRTRWSGKVGSRFAATLRIVGNDDIEIVTNITSIINKEKDVTLRNITIDSSDGIFSGFIVVGISDTSSLNNLIKKIKTVKGVKDVERSN